MNREDYRKAFDELSFSADFQERTEALLRQRTRELEKEKPMMQFKRTKKMAVLIAASVAVLVVSVSAAVLWLSPSQVAEQMDEPALAAAFESDGAVLIGETRNAGDYTVGLLGMVGGKDLAAFGDELEEDHTYVVASLARTDGTALEQETYQPFQWTVTPLVEGYRVNAVNNWTLDAFAQCRVIDGAAYYIMDIQNLGIFADHTVYLAVYEGGAPSMDLFSMTRDGAISMRDSVVGTLFTLPLDKSLADPAAAQALVESTGIEYTPITDEELEAVDTERPEVVISGEDGEKLITIGGTAAQSDGAMEPFTAESFEAYMAAEIERMKGELAGGILSQETYDKTAAELEEVLAGLKDGTMAAFLSGGDTLVTGTASNDDYGFEYSRTGNGTVGVIITDAK